jgi:hypothetical protein
MYKIFMSGFALVVFSGSVNAATDFIECKRVKSSFKQFCYVNENNNQTIAEINKTVDINQDTVLDYQSVIQNKEITIQTIDSEKPNTLILQGLSPRVKVDVQWENQSACRVSDLWGHRISLSAMNSQDSSIKTLRPIAFGPQFLDINLSLHEPDGINLSQYTVNGDKLLIETNISFQDLDHEQSQPPAYQRIPLNCSLNGYSLEVGFDAPSISIDIKNLKTFSSTQTELLSSTTVLHANFVDSQSGAYCAPYNLAEKLLEVEDFVFGFSDLSFPSQSYISGAIKDAIDIGAIDGANIPAGFEWDFFLSNEYQETIQNRCVNIPQGIINVDIQQFINSNGDITNHQGYNNALAHKRAKENLLEIIKAAYAIIAVSKFELINNLDSDWVESSVIRNNLGWN